MIIVGIDPGKTGGVAALDEDGMIVFVYQMPIGGNDIDVRSLGRMLLIHGQDSIQEVAVFVEKVHAMPNNGSIASFSLGESFGTIKTVVQLTESPLFEVPPQTWKKEVLAGTKKDKAAAIDYCLRAWPGVDLLPTARCRVPSDGMADALCIAEYGRRKWRREHAQLSGKEKWNVKHHAVD